MNGVAVLGVGMHRFGMWHSDPPRRGRIGDGRVRVSRSMPRGCRRMHERGSKELEYYELLCVCRPGEAEGLVESGDTELGGRVCAIHMLKKES